MKEQHEQAGDMHRRAHGQPHPAVLQATQRQSGEGAFETS